MKTVSVSELKAKLSRYLREVRRGGEIHVVDRGVPVARIVPLDRPETDDAARERLIRAGILTPGKGDASWVLSDPPLELSASLLDALNEEREDRV
jgi:prevent-host-death family protein